ncbi:glyoxalase-like domain-containing protein [Auriculariales sp. MPI-PUGE-AT-0066]|nr:glyoxalase-like domain-containing protein [Auriculariales sp. MPI-PUGE-AT-0066]
MTDILDHIVYLIPPGSLHEAVANFTSLGFNVIPGGTHAGGETYNALILFDEGPYIELISFTRPPVPDSTHRWAQELPGWIDWAHLGTSDQTTDLAQILNSRSSNQYEYDATVPGGRERPDGRVLKWRITAPKLSRHSPGSIPFFCGDVTPRDWRVPSNVDKNVDHENGALGVAYVRLLTTSDPEIIRKRFDGVLGHAPAKGAIWKLQTPSKRQSAELIVDAPKTDEEIAFLKEKGRETALYQLGIRVANAGSVTVQQSLYGRLEFVV